MFFKPGVNAEGVQKETWYALGVFDALYYERGCTLIVTSLTDGVHPDLKNIHGRGYAADLRISNVSAMVLRTILDAAKEMLYTRGYDIVLESDHVHVEYDPKPGRDKWVIEA